MPAVVIVMVAVSPTLSRFVVLAASVVLVAAATGGVAGPKTPRTATTSSVRRSVGDSAGNNLEDRLIEHPPAI